MRFLTIASALFAAIVTAQAQNNAISIPEGSSTLDVTAGEPLTLDWTNPSSGTVTIKLVQEPITPTGGITLASGVPASDLTATVQIPDGADLNSFQYVIEIIDDTNPDNYNFSPNFGVTGATGTATASGTTASATGSTASRTSTGSSTETDSTVTASSTDSTSTDSTSSAASTTSRSSSSSSSSRTTAATTSPSAASTSSAPDSNVAAGLKVQGGVMAMAVGAFVAVM